MAKSIKRRAITRTTRNRNNPDNPIRDFKYLSLTDLEPTVYNPSSRTETRALRALKTSIKEIGILSPLLVKRIGRGNKHRILEGHRRYAAVKELNADDKVVSKIDRVVVRVIDGNKDEKKVFMDANSSTKKLNGKQYLEMILNGGIDAIPIKQKENFVDLKRIGEYRNDRILAQTLLDKGTSIGTVSTIMNSIYNYVEKGGSETKKEILEYILKHDKLTVLRAKYKKGKDRLWNMIRRSELIT